MEKRRKDASEGGVVEKKDIHDMHDKLMCFYEEFLEVKNSALLAQKYEITRDDAFDLIKLGAKLHDRERGSNE